MKTYNIIVKTNWYSANRTIKYGEWKKDRWGGAYSIIECGLSLKEAQKRLKDLWNKENDLEYPHMDNWGLIVRWYGANSFPDGTRSFDSDVFSFAIEEVKSGVEVVKHDDFGELKYAKILVDGEFVDTAIYRNGVWEYNDITCCTLDELQKKLSSNE